jgi:hypothetical protein
VGPPESLPDTPIIYFRKIQLIATYDKYLRVQLQTIWGWRHEKETALDIRKGEGTVAGRQEIR